MSSELEISNAIHEFERNRKPVNHDLLDLEVAEALATLRKKYPGQEVGVRVLLYANNPNPEYWVSVQYPKEPVCYAASYSDVSVHEALEFLATKTKDRSQDNAKQARIEALRKELAELDAPLNRPQPAWIKGCSDTLSPHERGLGGEPERR